MVEYESRHEPRPVDMKAIVDIGISQVCRPHRGFLWVRTGSQGKFVFFQVSVPINTSRIKLSACRVGYSPWRSKAAVKFISWLLEKQEAWRPSSEEARWKLSELRNCLEHLMARHRKR